MPQKTGMSLRKQAESKNGIKLGETEKNTGETGNNMSDTSQNINNQINSISTEAENAAGNAPKIDDINETSSTMDINANEHHPRNFLSTANQMADEVDFEEGVEGSNSKADSKARRTARKEILDDVKALPQNKEPMDKFAEAEKIHKANKEEKKKAVEAKKEENKKALEEANKTVNDFEKEKGVWNRLKSAVKGAKNKLKTQAKNAVELGVLKAGNAVDNAVDRLKLEGKEIKANVDYSNNNEGLINEIDRISKLPDGEEKENAIKALEEKYGVNTDTEAINKYNEDLKKYNAAENRALQGALYDTLYSKKEDEKAAAEIFLANMGLDQKSPEELKQLLDQVKKENAEFFSQNGNDEFYKNLNSQTATNDYLSNNEKPIQPETSPIRDMFDRYVNNYKTTFDEAKEKSRLDKIKRNKNLYKGYLIWTNLMSKIQEASHNFANPNDRIEAADAISQRQGQDISSMIANRNSKNENYIKQQEEYLKTVLGKDIETAGFAEEMKNSRLKAAYSKMNEEQKKLLGALIVADTNHTISPTYKLQLADQMIEGKITTAPQLLGALAGLGIKTDNKVIAQILEWLGLK